MCFFCLYKVCIKNCLRVHTHTHTHTRTHARTHTGPGQERTDMDSLQRSEALGYLFCIFITDQTNPKALALLEGQAARPPPPRATPAARTKGSVDTPPNPEKPIREGRGLGCWREGVVGYRWAKRWTKKKKLDVLSVGEDSHKCETVWRAVLVSCCSWTVRASVPKHNHGLAWHFFYVVFFMFLWENHHAFCRIVHVKRVSHHHTL